AMGETRKDKVFREKLKISAVTATIEQGQLRWLGHVLRRGDEKRVRQTYKAKEIRKKEKRKKKKELEGRTARSGREKRNETGKCGRKQRRTPQPQFNSTPKPRRVPF
ncbi:hypothetical protein ILUMI_19460, partial [Ignelater luminosus]